MAAGPTKVDVNSSDWIDGFQTASAEKCFNERQRIKELEQALRELVEAADWYRRCLEDVIDRSPVRGLDEAKTGYDRAASQAREILGGD